MNEFVGPNFKVNNYAGARMMVGDSRVDLDISSRGDLRTVRVPTDVRVFEDGEWKRHASVFEHYGSYDALKHRDGMCVVFTIDDSGRMSYISLAQSNSIQARAESLGLTLGNVGSNTLIARSD